MGVGTPLSSQWTTALASPATNRSAASTARRRTASTCSAAALFDGDIDKAPNRRVAYEYGLAGAYCLRSHYGAVEYEMGRSRHEDLVLCTGGLAFGAVRDDYRLPLLAGDGGELEQRSESSRRHVRGVQSDPPALSTPGGTAPSGPHDGSGPCNARCSDRFVDSPMDCPCKSLGKRDGAS